MLDIEVRMLDVENISKLVIEDQKAWLLNPRYNEYMKLRWNLDALRNAITEVEMYLDPPQNKPQPINGPSTT